MGYTTEFEGSFSVEPSLSTEHEAYLKKFSETRRMVRNPQICAEMPDPVRIAVGLPVGSQGEFFVGGTGFYGQDDDTSIINYNASPRTQPGLWCKWVPVASGRLIEWNGAEKFSNYEEWLRYLIDTFLRPWGYEVNGKIFFKGEQRSDKGWLVVRNNIVSIEPVELNDEDRRIEEAISLLEEHGFYVEEP